MKKFKKIMSIVLAMTICFSVDNGSCGNVLLEASESRGQFLGVKNQQDLDGLTLHDKKLYDNFKNIGGYVRPSIEAIKNDYKASSVNGKHPRLMITDSSVKNLRKEISDSNNSKSWWYSRLKAKGDTLASNLLGENKNDYLFKYTACYGNSMGSRMPGIGGKGTAADQFREDMLILGMNYQLSTISSEKDNYANAAWVMLSVVSNTEKFQDINPWHDLDFGFFCQGYAIAYDWMYDAWSTTQKNTLEKAIKIQCFRPANDSYTDNNRNANQTSSDGVVMGVYTNHNHNPIVNSGITMAALALMDKYPDLTTSLCHDAFICLERDLNVYGNSGVSSEGLEYMLLSINNLSMMFSSLETSLGKLYGLDTCPGFADGRVMNAIRGMESDVGSFSFSDTYDSFINNPGELYFCKHYNLHGYRNDILERLKNTQKNNFTYNVQLLCWNEDESKDCKITLDRDMVVGGNKSITDDLAFATFRNSFEKGQSFAGIKAGKTVKDFFVHLDQGSFVYNALGVKWAADMGKDSYGLTGYSSPKGGRWNIFRLRPDGHNILLINPNKNDCGYELEKTASLTTDVSESEAMAVVDMTNLVSKKANSEKRGMLLTDNRLSLVIRDEVSLKDSSDLYWIMYTEQNVKIENNSAVLSSGDKKVKLDFASSADGKLYTESASPWKLVPEISGQNSNDSYKRIVFKISGANGDVNITAKFTPVVDETKDAPSVTEYGPISEWKLKKDSLDENKDTEDGNANVEGGNKEKNNSEIINDEKSEDELINIKVNKLKNGIIVKGKKAKYKITKIVYKNGKAVRGTAKLMNPLSKKNKTFIIADYIKVSGIKFKVTSINKKAFYKNKKLKKVTLGKYIVSIGAKAFAGCKNLKNIKFKTKRLKKVGKSAFKGIKKKAVVRISKKKYKRLLRKKGMKKTVIFKQFTMKGGKYEKGKN